MPAQLFNPSGSFDLDFGDETNHAVRLKGAITEWKGTDVDGVIRITIKLHDGHQGGRCEIVLKYPKD
jgi:hypothetical protein